MLLLFIITESNNLTVTHDKKQQITLYSLVDFSLTLVKVVGLFVTSKSYKKSKSL